MKTKLFGVLLPLLLLCACARFENGGAYSTTTTNVVNGVTNVTVTGTDKAFYTIDAAFDFSYALLDKVFTFERDNRALLWSISPDIKHGLDKIRPQASDVVRRYALARRAYKANPTPGNLSTLETILGQLRALSLAANEATKDLQKPQ